MANGSSFMWEEFSIRHRNKFLGGMEAPGWRHYFHGTLPIIDHEIEKTAIGVDLSKLNGLTITKI